ncbi:hypothetical protein LCGC14_2782500, partial [marine sediment metagenome]
PGDHVYLSVDVIEMKIYYTPAPSFFMEDWLNTNSVTTQNDDDAYVSLSTSTEDTSDWLILSNFGFNIPTGAVIDGIEVLMDREATQSSSIRDEQLYLRKTGGQIGDNKADSVNYWDIIDDDIYDSYGGTTDLWGTTWTAAEINSVDFGIDLYVKYFGSVATDARIDHLQIRVYYTETFNGVMWDWADRISAGDGSYTVSFINTIGGFSDWLRATNFDFSSIPDDATLDGIEVSVKKVACEPYGFDYGVHLSSNSIQVGDDKSKLPSWGMSPSYYIYGGPTDTWNSGLAISDIKSPNFGVDISGEYPTGSPGDHVYLSVDVIEMRIYYSNAFPIESWVDTNKAVVQDDDNVYVTLSPSTDSSDWLQLTNFGFNLPSGATIDGIEVLMDKEATQSSSIRDEALYLRKTNRQIGSN